MTNQYTDHTGVVRNLGSWTIPEGFVSSYAPYGDAPDQPLFSEEEIKRIVTDPSRVDRQLLIPFEKYGSDQSSTSACNGHAAAGAYSDVRVLAGKDDGWRGSGAYVYSLINQNRDQGSNLEDGMNVLGERGVCSVTTVPNDRIFIRMYSSSEANAEAEKHKALKAYRAKTIQGFESGLAAGHIGVCAVMAGRNFDNFTDGVAGVVSGMGNHSVRIIDIRWRNGELQYLLRNSWSIRWGLKGDIWITRKHLIQCWNYHVAYLVPATQDLN